MINRRKLSILCAVLAAAGLHGAAHADFVTVPVQPAGSQPPIFINKKINLDTPTETQDRANTFGVITRVPRGSILRSTRSAPIVVNGVRVGTLYDRVWCQGTGTTCDSTNTYTLGLRVRLNANPWNPTGFSFEINDFFRAIRATAPADVAYERGSFNPLPTVPPFPMSQPNPGTSSRTASAYKDLELVSRTLQGLFEPAGSLQYANKVTNNAWINFRVDVNKDDDDVAFPFSYNSEWSPWMYVRQVCPTGYNPTPQALKGRLWQGGEEGQTPQAILTTMYVCN